MATFNKVMMMGNLTRDPEMRQIPTGASVCTLGLAVNRSYRTASGETKDDTCFINVNAWGKLAEICSTYLRKGSPIFVDGSLRMEQWQDQSTGQSRTRHSVTAENVQFLPSNQQRQDGQGQGNFGPSPDSYVDKGYSAPQQGGGFAPAPQQGNFAPAPQQGNAYAPAAAPQNNFAPAPQDNFASAPQQPVAAPQVPQQPMSAPQAQQQSAPMGAAPTRQAPEASVPDFSTDLDDDIPF